jgi:hypothetical protein
MSYWSYTATVSLCDSCILRVGDSPGPSPTPVLSIVACAGRGELGRLLFNGSGGGSICVEVLLEVEREGGCWGVLVVELLVAARGDRPMTEMSGIVKSGNCPLLWQLS